MISSSHIPTFVSALTFLLSVPVAAVIAPAEEPKSGKTLVQQQQEQPAAQMSEAEKAKEMLQSPGVSEAMQELIQKTMRTETRTKTERVKVYQEQYYWEWYCWRGRLYKRLRKRLVPRIELRTRTFQVQTPAFPGAELFQDPDNPEVGAKTINITLQPLPSAAGGRASRISSVAQGNLPLAVEEVIRDRDRILALTSTGFTPVDSDPTKERAYRIAANVESPDDSSVKLTVLVLQRDAASGVLDNNTPSLNRIAESLANETAGELEQ